MRDSLIKLYLNDREAEIVQKLAKKYDLPVNRYLRKMLSIEASKYGFSDADTFNIVYTKRNGGKNEFKR